MNSLGYDHFESYKLLDKNSVDYGKLYLRDGEEYEELVSTMEIMQGEKIYFKLDTDTLKQNKGNLSDQTSFTLIAFDNDGNQSQAEIINYIDINHENEVPSMNKIGTIATKS